MVLKPKPTQFVCDETGTIVEVNKEDQTMDVTPHGATNGVRFDEDELHMIFDSLGWFDDDDDDDDDDDGPLEEEIDGPDNQSDGDYEILLKESERLKDHVEQLVAEVAALKTGNVSLVADAKMLKRGMDQAKEDLWQTEKQLQVTQSQYNDLLVGISGLISKLGIKNASGKNCVAALEQYISCREPPAAITEFLHHYFAAHVDRDAATVLLECPRVQQVGNVKVKVLDMIEWALKIGDSKNFKPPEAT